MNALAYAHFYVGIYYQLKGLVGVAYSHLKEAVDIGNHDYIGRLMRIHFETFCKTLRQTLRLGERGRGMGRVICGGWQLSKGHDLTGEGAATG